MAFAGWSDWTDDSKITEGRGAQEKNHREEGVTQGNWNKGVGRTPTYVISPQGASLSGNGTLFLILIILEEYQVNGTRFHKVYRAPKGCTIRRRDNRVSFERGSKREGREYRRQPSLP